MCKKDIVITGIGVIAPNAIGKNDFWNALAKGLSGIKPVTLLDTTNFKSKLAAECSTFEPKAILGDKGLRNLNRVTMLIAAAAKIAIKDASLSVSEENTDNIGVVTATTLSVASDVAEFTKEVVRDGPGMVNPVLFPPITMNFPSSHLAIRYKIKGFNATISTGFSAGLDALKYAVDMINSNRAKVVLVGSVESFSLSNFLGFYVAGFLSGKKGQEISCPFDKRRNGIILGEAATVLVIEDEKHALAREANIMARILSVKAFFDAFRNTNYDPKMRSLKRSMIRALESAGLSVENIDYICAAANSIKEQDKLETEAIKDVFNIYARNIPVSSIKSMVGESVSASGGLQVVSAVGAIVNGVIPPTVNYEKPDPCCDLDYVPNISRKADVNNVLINNFGPGANSTTAIISKY